MIRSHIPAAAAVVGGTAGAIAWSCFALVGGDGWSAWRLDQVTALLLGSAVGAATLGARAKWRGVALPVEVVVGLVLGGAGTLAGASLIATWGTFTSPAAFVLERALCWAVAAAGASVALNWYLGWHSSRAPARSVGLAMLAGAGAGAMLSFPGVPDLWQAFAAIWIGAGIAVSCALPDVTIACAAVRQLPRRGEHIGVATVREVRLTGGDLHVVGPVTLAVIGGRVAVYPPAGGVTINGHRRGHPAWITCPSILASGGIRYQIDPGAPSP